MTAAGSISGQDRQWTGNCPGGGHGELVLTGSYVIDKPSESEAVSFPAFQAPVMPGALTEVDIPALPAVSDLSCEISAASSKTDHSVSIYRIETPSMGSPSLVRINQQGSKTIDVNLAGSKLEIRVT